MNERRPGASPRYDEGVALELGVNSTRAAWLRAYEMSSGELRGHRSDA